MFRNICLALVCVGALAACQTTTSGQQPLVVDQFIGKTLVDASGTVFRYAVDGTIGGEFRGQTVVGTYTADGREMCSTFSAPPDLTGRTFCSAPAVTGDTVVFNRRDGSQSVPYQIQG